MKSTVDSPNRIQDRQWVENNYNLPEFGDSECKIYTIKGTLIARGFTRMVYGDHGPYIELDSENLIEEAWLPIKEKSSYAYYDERYPKDGSDCKLYIQNKSVKCLPNPPKGKNSVPNNRIGEGYADYKVGKIYISPEHIMKRDMLEIMEI